ncbi:MAG: type II toxin-antitoxin system RelE family toxin [Thermoanaerobaculia bacterium]
MKVLFKKVFLKDLAAVPAKMRPQIERFVFEEMPRIESVEAIGRVEKLKGYTGYYKTRFGDYRVGMRVEGDTVTFERVLNRKEIYRKFP